MLKKDFNFLLDLLEKTAGWQFSEKQYFIIEKKIANFVRSKEYRSVENLIAELKLGRHQLINQVVESTVFSDTMFFRDAEVFDALETKILPILKNKCRARKQINVWSLGCSSGQETYSIAMMFDKCKKAFNDWKISIHGSDISSIAINKASRGIFNCFEIQTGLNARDILTYFDNIDDQWIAKDILKKMIEFKRYNMLEELIVVSKFELVLCRNVLKYFNEEHQDKILQRISSCQPQGGYLLVGKNERIPAIEKYYYPSPDNSDCYIALGNQHKIQKGITNISVSSPSQNTEEQYMPTFTKPKDLI